MQKLEINNIPGVRFVWIEVLLDIVKLDENDCVWTTWKFLCFDKIFAELKDDTVYRCSVPFSIMHAPTFSGSWWGGKPDTLFFIFRLDTMLVDHTEENDRKYATNWNYGRVASQRSKLIAHTFHFRMFSQSHPSLSCWRKYYWTGQLHGYAQFLVHVFPQHHWNVLSSCQCSYYDALHVKLKCLDHPWQYTLKYTSQPEV